MLLAVVVGVLGGALVGLLIEFGPTLIDAIVDFRMRNRP